MQVDLVCYSAFRDLKAIKETALKLGTEVVILADHFLVNHNFRRVPILEKGKLVGLISRADIIAFILKNRSHFHSQKRLR